MIKKIMVLCLIVIVSLCGSVTAFADEEPTEDKTEIVTEQVTDEVTEIVTEDITEAETEPLTEITTEVTKKEDYQYTIILLLFVMVCFILCVNILK